MTADPGASALIGAQPQPQPLPADASTRAQGVAERQALLSNAAWRERFQAGDEKAVSEMREALAKAQHHTFEGNALAADSQVVNAERESPILAMKRIADLSPEVEQQVRSGQSVTAAEFKAAQQEKARLMSDRDWVRKYLDGNREARTRMCLLSIIIGSPVAAEPAK